MTFTVTYRGADGALREEAVEAAGRAECFAQCRARGIAPVSVREGARKGGRKNAASPKMATQGGAGRAANVSAAPRGGTWKAAVLAAAVLAVVGGGLWWFLAAREDAHPPAPKAVKAVKDVKVVKAVKDVKDLDVHKAVPDAPAATNAPAQARAHSPTGRVIKAHSARSGRVMTLADGTVVTNTPRVFFKRDFERALHVALMPNGMGGTILRQVRSRYTDEQILAMLKERVLPDPDDDATTAAVKAKVQDFKDEVLRVVGEGSSVSEVLDGMTRRKVEDGLLRARALKIRTEALRSGDPELARESIQSANAVLRENGLRELDMPKGLAKEGPQAGGTGGDDVSEVKDKGEDRQ